MPILNRTALTNSDKLDLLAKTLACQAHGNISSLASEFDISRKAVYQARDEAQACLQHLVENNQPEVITTVGVDKPHLRRAIIALAITAPNSIRAIEEQLPLIYPGCKVSYGYIQGVIIEAQRNAAKFNQQVSLSNIRSVALDEMFSQGDPVLAGIDLDSGYLFSLSHEQRRNGDTWARVLQQAQSQGMSPYHVVKDGAKGMASGVSAVFAEAEQRDDAFHALYIVGKAVQKTERCAYRYISKEVDAQKVQSKTAPCNQDAYQRAVEATACAERKCQMAIDQYESAAKAMRYLHGAFSSVCLNSGVLMTPEMAKARLTKAVQHLRNTAKEDCCSAALYLENRLTGLTLATEALYEKLQALSEQYTQEQVGLACRIFEHKRKFKKLRCWQQADAMRELAYSYYLLRTSLGEKQCDALLDAVERLLDSRHRASSAIEGFNASLRTYLYVRKGVNQGFLELFQAWYNLRARRWGKHKGKSAYESLTGKKVDDWLTVLGFAPSPHHH